MNSYPIYQVDSFTDVIFSGNPAAVCPLQTWLPDATLQNIAAENNLSETAFYVITPERTEIRWFTPTTEVDLCGHATLAAAFILFFQECTGANSITLFSPRSGELSIHKKGDVISLDFPSDTLTSVAFTSTLHQAFSIAPQEILKGKTDYLFIYNTEQEIRDLTIDFQVLMQLDCRGVIVSAPGEDCDFVSRFFCPQVGINEDPVTGSAHTSLAPYWAKKMEKTRFTAQQLSARKGSLLVEYLGERTAISGHARLYLKGELFID